jgi:enamine deaminase RidA (YjgF/YER057c/UK114 family)
MPVKRTLAVAASAAVVFAGGAAAAGAPLPVGLDFGTDPPRERTPPPRPRQVITNLPPGAANPAIASGVSIGSGVPLYRSSGTGPAVLDATAPAGTPEQYVDPALVEDEGLRGGVTVTEAQGLNTLRRLEANLASVGLELADVVSMQVFLDNPPGAPVADFAGFNRAYRQFFANVDLTSGDVVPVPTGTGAPAPPLVVNATRPSRSLLEVGTLPVPGWLVEIEVVARFDARR